MKKIYLAGPDVFREDALEYFKALKVICKTYGFEGLSPFDNEIAPDVSPEHLSQHIYNGNIKLLQECDLVVANVTPFRGFSADPGTAFEMGYAKALGKPVYTYYVPDTEYAQRASIVQDTETLYPVLEDFGLSDNLMLVHSAHWSTTTGLDALLAHLASFEKRAK